MKKRQVAPERGHDPDARVFVAEARMDVHAADESAAHGLLIRRREPPVALAGRGRLLPP